MPERIKYLDSLRAIAILMVVGIHAEGYAGLDITKNFDSFLVFIVHTIAVPSFFLADGYLFALRVKQPFGYGAYISKSAMRLLIPWLIFFVLYTGLRILLELKGFVSQYEMIGKSFKEIVTYLYSSGPAPQLYFLLSLFILRILSFVLIRLAMAPPKMVILFFLSYAIIFRTVLIHVPHVDGDPFFAAAGGLQYFIMGILFYKYRHFIERFSIHIIILSTVLLILYTAVNQSASWVPNRRDFLVKFFYLIGSYCFFMTMTKRNNFLSILGRRTMDIYLLHAPILIGAVAIGVLTITVNRINSFVLIMIITYFASFLLAKLIRLFPYGCLLFGEKRIA